MDMKLAGKRALITGSTSGIGAAIAKTLAAEGVAVAINGRDEGRANEVAGAIRAAGGKAVLALGDVQTQAGVDKVVKAALDGLGGVDILVNNTGGSDREQKGQGWFDPSGEVWLATYERNVVSSVRLIHQLAPAMKERGWGRIIQIASASGTAPTAAQPDYGAAKGAAINMTVAAAKGLSRTGITVNTVSPGMTETPALTAWMRRVGEAQGFGDDLERAKKFILDNYLPQTVNHIGQPEDIADLVVFVASPRADFINGANFRADGGVTPSVN
jgi:3-oxoacyl-[acyl-carrier protein] reductase